MSSALFPRNFRKLLPLAVRGEGCYLVDADGRQYLDAAGGAAVVTIGHGVDSIARAMTEQASRLAYVHSSQFRSAVAEDLAQRLLAMAPPGFLPGGRVFFTSGGSEAAETALKLARQYFLERGEEKRVRVVARGQAYHGSTLGALAVSGIPHRRESFAPMLPDWGRIPPCYCLRCPLGLRYPECNVDCADELDRLVSKEKKPDVAAFIFEPVSGAALGAVPPPDGYVQRLAEICQRQGILLIADEVMTGMGRTGKPFAVNHWGVSPDIILLGKGIASGYAPLGAVLVSAQVAETIARGSGTFTHGFTYSAHPVAAAAGVAVLDYIRENKLFERVAPVGRDLMKALEPLRQLSVVGDVRGLGLLIGIEIVRDPASLEPFPPDAHIAARIQSDALDKGVLTYPMQGCVDGVRGDHILLAPPFTVTSAMIQTIAGALVAAIEDLDRAHRTGTGGATVTPSVA